jgi:sterol desaturase/sphingolipid hydroxylase (fatty acid hydroxylase superfamily)
VAASGGFSRFLDYATPAAFVAVALSSTQMLIQRGVPDFLVTTIVTLPLALVAAVLERVRPERAEYKALDQPFMIDVAHFLIPYQFGYFLAIAGCAGAGYLAERAGITPVWPRHWPLVLQILAAGLVLEGVSYWQHRLLHRVPFLWRFHALHHSGERLNLLRAGRFHFVDIGLAVFVGLTPLVVLGAPDAIITWTVTINGVLGILEHANMRMRTPAWLAYVVCTPAVHRHHHSKRISESNHNFCTYFTLFDVLFGTFQPPRADGPEAVGIEGDRTPRGFLNQIFAPFRAAP